MVYVDHILAILCIAVATYLARYISLRYGHKLAKIEKASTVLRSCTIAIITSLVTVSLIPVYLQHNMEIVIPTTLGVLVSIALAKKLRNIGIVAVIGLLTYVAVHSVLQYLVI
ncbi:MAG: AzlD domain-containing protein [Crenarchaeota archaeon]|nr:AzlD domain-containing protein [Thermoproteota archaeon]